MNKIKFFVDYERNGLMITGKQRAYLRKLAHGIDPVFQIGKGGVSDVLIDQLSKALEARELIKITILETSMLETRATCDAIAGRLGAEPIQSIGSKFVLYKRASKEKNRKIEIPR